MKNIVKAFAVLAGIMSLAACVKTEYNAVPFVSLNARSATVPESDPATTWLLPVHVRNHAKPCTVTYTVEAIDAQSGVDYELVDASGVLNFTGNESKNIAIAIKGQVGTYTGDLKFRVKLVSATDGVELGALSTCTVSIKDLDHPLSALFGDYTFSSVFNVNGGYNYGSWEMNMSAYEGNTSRVWIDKMTIFQADAYYNAYIPKGSVYGIVSEDRTTIEIPVPQEMESTAASAFGVDEPFTLYKYTGHNINADFEKIGRAHV